MTAKRLARVRETLNRRQLDCTVALDQVHKMHNLSAIIRSCDATGIANVHAVELDEALKTFRTAAAGAQGWVNLHKYNDTPTMINTVKSQGMKVYAAHFSDRAVDFRSIDYTKPCCILMGAELDGISDNGAEMADEHIIIPMLGMVASLNVSVAAALVLYEIQRQREIAGMYSQPQYSAADIEKLTFEWMQPKMARHCQRNNQPYPHLDEDGDLTKA